MPGTPLPVTDAEIRIWLTMRLDKLRNQIAGFKGHMARIANELRGFQGTMTKMNKKLNRLSSGFKKNKMSVQGWLGVGLSAMFIAQGLASFFDRLIMPVLEITGIFDVWKATLISVLGPVLIPLSLILIDIMKWFMGLDPAQKKFIAWVVIIGWLVSKVVAVIAMVVILAIGLAAVGVGGGTIVGALIGIGWAVLIVAGAILWLWNVVSAFFSSEGWKKTAKIINVVLLTILIIIGVIIAVVAAAPATVIAAVIAIGLIIMTLVNLIIDNWEAIATFFSDLFTKWIPDIFMDFYNWVKGWGNKVAEAILGPFAGVAKALGGIKGFSVAAGMRIGQAMGFQHGGIVTRPTLAMIGEAGPEAVVPLTGGNAGSPIEININVNGQFTTPGSMHTAANLIQIALRDELRRLGIR